MGMNSKNADSTQCVRVAVNIRPLSTAELLHGCINCITVPTGEPQVQIGTNAFTYDFVYGSTGSPSSGLYDGCVAPLIDALFLGYNATVLAYGQTGSGKTYTMGTNFTGEESAGGIIPNVMRSIFKRVQDLKEESNEFLIRVSFIEIFNEEVFDLLDTNVSKGIQIRKTLSGGITLAGVTEPEVKTLEEMSSYFSLGCKARVSRSTKMNSKSSRSHAIFSITMEQKNGDHVLSAKLHLVDLAGSERAKRTGAVGARFREGTHINMGLLALGNVISALGDKRKRKEGGHVPYRNSKLTRLLQDSLGGNTKTVIIACISPADTNTEETLNTLKYANRARNIKNKLIINRDPMGAQQQQLQSRIVQLEAELLCFKGVGGVPFEEFQILKDKVSLLEASNAELQRELDARGQTCESLKERACDAQVENDQLIMKVEAIQNGRSWDEIDSNSNQDCDLVTSYVSKIHDLEEELLHLKNLTVKSSNFVDWDSDDLGLQSKNGLFAGGNEYSSDCDVKPVDITDDVEPVEIHEKELEHSSAQEKLDRELKELDKKLEQKELKKERRKNEYERHKLLAWNQRTEMELQRKKEEASLATKRLMELLESRKASSRETGISGNGPGIQALMQAIEHELEVTVGVHGVRLEYQRQMEVSSEMAKENARLKEEAEMMRLNNTRNVSMSPAARSSRIFALKNMLATSSTTLVSTACQLSEAEERERVFSGKGRWNQVRSLPEAKNLMNFLFNLASSSRCSLREKEIICRDKDMEISDLKQKIVSLRCSLEQLKRQRSDSMRDSESDDYAVDATDDEWVPSPKFRKRKPKGGEHSSREKNHYSDISSDDAKDTQTASFVSCSCSRSSSCKTSRCVCIRMKIGCGSSCRCQETKCGNRVSRATENDSDTQGTELLQGTLVKRPAEVKTDDGGAKKISF